MSKREKLYTALATGLFVFLFLIFFQPFGVNNYDPTETIRWPFLLAMLGMGLLVFITITFNELVVFPLFIKQPTRLSVLVWIVWTILLLSTTIYFYYNVLGNWHDFSWSSWFEFVGNIGTLALIPILAVIIYLRLKRLSLSLEDLRLNKAHHQDLRNAAEDIIHFTAENDKDYISLKLQDILYLESEDNYVAIHYLDHEEQLSKKLIRTSLKRLEELSIHRALQRCHRSYMINLYHVRRFSGNRSAALIHLNHISKGFPVSRPYFDDLHQLLVKK